MDSLLKLKQALWDYHNALDRRMHGGVAAHDLVGAVESILERRWVQGYTKSTPRPSETADDDLDAPLLRVVCAACRHRNSGIIIPSVRHRDRGMKDLNRLIFSEGEGPEEDGFLINNGSFADRRTAWKIAKAAGQIVKLVPDQPAETLYSENLY